MTAAECLFARPPNGIEETYYKSANFSTANSGRKTCIREKYLWPFTKLPSKIVSLMKEWTSTSLVESISKSLTKKKDAITKNSTPLMLNSAIGAGKPRQNELSTCRPCDLLQAKVKLSSGFIPVERLSVELYTVARFRALPLEVRVETTPG